MKQLEPESRGGFRHTLDNRQGLMLLQERSKTRIETRSDKSVIRGYAAVFFDESARDATEYWLWSDMVERVMPGAFDRAIAEAHDARALFNHDGNWLLGRVSAGTARLSVDSIGLSYEVDEDPNDPQWNTVAAKIDRGDVTGSSFAFRARQTNWIETPEYYVRQLMDVDLYDVSPVTWPAYTGTSAGRSRRDNVTHPDEIAELIRERNASLSEELPSINARLASMGLGLLKG